MPGELFVGVMSGTSLDGVDAVVADFSGRGGRACELLGIASRPFPRELRAELFALQAPSADEVARAARASNALADAYAEAIAGALSVARVDAADVAAAGVHGQTVRHAPHEGWTLQLNNAARVAERTGMTVVADFRSRDIAAGGEGAPLVPAFHAALFARADEHRVVVNLGGIANVTDLPPAGLVRGFDTGPGNVLLDAWHARHRGAPFDRDGAWSASGRVDDALLARMLADQYFARTPPKSTGRDRFNAAWIDARLAEFAAPIAPADVQASLVALTARSIAAAIDEHCAGASLVYLGGGGANNAALVAALARALAPRRVQTTDAAGVPVSAIEPLAFAWLARETLAGRPGNLPEVTGAKGPRVLGAIYPR
jgi:anhydro-N-acetylmuramic acid kinase